MSAASVAALLLAFYAGSVLNAPSPDKTMPTETTQTKPSAPSLAEVRAAKIEAIRMAQSFYDAKNYEDAYKQAMIAASEEGSEANADAQYLLWKLGWDPAGHESFKMPETNSPLERAKASAKKLDMMPKIPLLTKEKSVEWLQKAVAQGHIRAQAILGRQYLLGSSVTPKDYAKALEFSRAAADHGDNIGQHNLGSIYWNGYGVAKDAVASFNWFKKSADNGGVEAMRFTAWDYDAGNVVAKSLPSAFYYFEKAAQKGDAVAQSELGYRLGAGIGTEKNYTRARYWLARAAAQHDMIAIRNLGWLYDNGYGVEKDNMRAVELFIIAAEGGDRDGAYYAGLRIWNIFKFDPRGNKLVRKYLTMAKDRGHPEAAQSLVNYNRGARLVNSIQGTIRGAMSSIFVDGVGGLQDAMNRQYKFIDQIIEQAVEQ